MTDLVLIPFAGRVLALEREVFNAALIAGAEMVPASGINSLPCAEPLLDPEQTAKAIGVSARLLEDLARSEQIPHHKIGKFTRFRVSEVTAASRVLTSSEQAAQVQRINPALRAVRSK